jgi:hypothetical protein
LLAIPTHLLQSLAAEVLQALSSLQQKSSKLVQHFFNLLWKIVITSCTWSVENFSAGWFVSL